MYVYDKRARLRILYDILGSIKRMKDGARFTYILYRTNLSVPLLKNYLKILLKDGLISQTNVNNKIVYRLTKKGNQFIKEMQKIDKMIRSLGFLRIQK